MSEQPAPYTCKHGCERDAYRDALFEALSLLEGHNDMSLAGSDHWLWKQQAHALLKVQGA